jgi:hypothetical protein
MTDAEAAAPPAAEPAADDPQLVAARANLKAATAKFNHVNAPLADHVAAVESLFRIIARGKSGQRGWGAVMLDSYRVLGGFLNSQKRLRGRAPKESSADSSVERAKTLAELDIEDRHDSALAQKVRAVPEEVYRDYLRTSEVDDEVPSYRGLMRFHDLWREKQDLEREPARQADDAKVVAEARARSTKGRTVTRVRAIKRTVDTIFHPKTDAMAAKVALDALVRLDPMIANRIKRAVDAAEVIPDQPTPATTKPKGFVSTTTYEGRIRVLEETVSEYRKKNRDLIRKLAKAQRELKRWKPKPKKREKAIAGGLPAPDAADDEPPAQDS